MVLGAASALNIGCYPSALVVERKRFLPVAVLRIVGLQLIILLAGKTVPISAHHGGRVVVDQGTAKRVHKRHAGQAPQNAARTSRIEQL